MNRSHKVVWNKVRRAYVATDENKLSHCKKSCKAILGISLISLCSPTVIAETLTIDNAYIEGIGTTKLIDGKDKNFEYSSIEVKTEGDFRKLANAVKDKNFSAIRSALGYDGTNATPVFLAGGRNYIDERTSLTLGMARLALKGDYKNKIDLIKDNTETIKNNETSTVSGSTSIIIGGDDCTPLVVGVTGGDNLFNTGLAFKYKPAGQAEPSIDSFEKVIVSLERKGDTNITALSGNIVGFVGGSSALNLQGVNITKKNVSMPIFGKQDVYIRANAAETTNTLEGSTSVTLSKKTTTVGGAIGSAAVALGGKSTATVTGSTALSIETTTNPLGFEGITVGVFGGGLAGATMDGTAESVVNGATTIELKSGMIAGLFGGGAALSAEIDGIWGRITPSLGAMGYADNIKMDAGLDWKGGTTTAISHDISIKASNSTSTAGIAGGGFAWANTGTGTSVDKSTIRINGDVSLVLGENGSESLTDAQKNSLHASVAKLLKVGMDAVHGKLPTFETGEELIAGTNIPGVHVGNVGGSVVLAHASGGAGASSQAIAVSEPIEHVYLTLAGGYNAFNLAGGLTIAQDDTGKASSDKLHAHSDVNNTVVKVTGGENVLVMGGGAAYATGTNGQTSGVESRSDVKNVSMSIEGGSVDGLYGGGLAIDDTNASATNAKANVETVSIEVSNGTINTANVDPILAFGQTGDSSGAPSSRTYLREAAKLVDADAGNAAILAGGMATGAGAEANVTNNAFVALSGGTVNGNVYGGGAATLGGKVNVAEMNILVQGATVNGDIYAGGLAGSPDNDNFQNAEQYSQAASTVEAATIKLESGSVTGNLYAGGYAYKGSESVTVSVKKADIEIYDNVFQGEKIVGDGADEATLTIKSSYDFSTLNAGKKAVALSGFDTISVVGDVSGLTYATGGKNAVFIGGPALFETMTAEAGKTISIGTTDKTSVIGAKAISGDGGYQVANGLFAIGNSNDVINAAQEAASSFGIGNSNVLYVTGTVEAKIGVGTNAPTTNGLAVADGVVIADAAGNTVINGTSTFDDQSTLYFVNVGDVGENEATQTVTIGGEASLVKTDNILWDWAYAADNGTYTFSLGSSEEIGLADDVFDFYKKLRNGDLLKGRLNPDQFKGEANLRGGMNLAAAAGVQTAAIQGAFTGIESAARRASLSENRLVGGSGITGYAEATGNYLEAGGSSSFNEVKVELGGVVVGGEWSRDGFTAGALANVGTGSVRGQGGNSGVKNDVDYYGFNVYAGKRFGDFNVVGQAGYLHSTNDLTDSSIGYASVDGVDAHAWTVGVRGETVFALSENARVVPYVGLNYVRVSTDGYSVSNGVHVSSVDQNLVTVPVGVAFTGTMATASGWNWSPNVDVSYVGVFGDRDVEATTTAGSAVGSVSMDVWNESAVRTRIGLEASKGAFAVGVNTGMTLGSDDARGLSGQAYVRYAF